MIAIHTKFIGPTNTRGSRIKAYTTTGFSATVAYPYAFVKALVKKHNLDWTLDDMRFGDSADGKGYTFCFDCSKVDA